MKIKTMFVSVLLLAIMWTAAATDVVQCYNHDKSPASLGLCPVMEVHFEHMSVKHATLSVDSGAGLRVFKVEFDGNGASPPTAFFVEFIFINGSAENDVLLTRRDDPSVPWLPFTSDTLDGGVGADYLEGGDGDDEIFAWKASDIVVGGRGQDVVGGLQRFDLALGGYTKINSCADATLYNVTGMLAVWKAAALADSPTMEEVANEMFSDGGLLDVNAVTFDDLEADTILDSQGRGVALLGVADVVEGTQQLECTYAFLCATVLSPLTCMTPVTSMSSTFDLGVISLPFTQSGDTHAASPVQHPCSEEPSPTHAFAFDVPAGVTRIAITLDHDGAGVTLPLVHLVDDACATLACMAAFPEVVRIDPYEVTPAQKLYVFVSGVRGDEDASAYTLTIVDRTDTAVLVPVGPMTTRNGQVRAIGEQNEPVPPREVDDFVCGAIQSVLAHPTNPDIVYVGATNGGLWKTTSATESYPHWVPLAQHLGSTSIGDLVFDELDGTHETVYAGIGLASSFYRLGGPRAGLLRTTDGGATFTLLDALAGKDLRHGLVVRGSTIVVGVANADQLKCGQTGIFKSTDGGVSFSQKHRGRVVALARSSATGTYLASITYTCFCAHKELDIPCAPNVADSAGLYRSTNDAETFSLVRSLEAVSSNGFTPSKLFRFETELNNAKMSFGPSNRLFVAWLRNGEANQIFYTDDEGETVTHMELPTTPNNNGFTDSGLNPREKPGSQGAVHFALLADPSDRTRFYVGGDRPAEIGSYTGAVDYTGRWFRGNTSVTPKFSSPSVQYDHLQDGTNEVKEGFEGGGTASRTSPHADARDMELRADGVAVEGDDGGVYVRTSPEDNTGDWFSIASNLQVMEVHDVAYDCVTRTAFVGTQDNGTPMQRVSGDPFSWRLFSEADGGDVAVFDGGATSFRFSSYQYLSGFRRSEWSHDGKLLGVRFLGRCNGVLPPFVTPIAVHPFDGNVVMHVCSNGLYYSDNGGLDFSRLIFAVLYEPRTMAIPIADPSLCDVINSKKFFRFDLNAKTKVVTKVSDDVLTGLATNSLDANHVFVSTASDVYVSIDGGVSFALAPFTVPSDHHPIDSLAWASSLQRLVIGALGMVYVVDNSGASLIELSTELPRTRIFDMHYNFRCDTLVVGLLGRGVYQMSFVGDFVLSKKRDFSREEALAHLHELQTRPVVPVKHVTLSEADREREEEERKKVYAPDGVDEREE